MGDYYHTLDAIPGHQVSVGTIQLLSGQQGSIFWITTDAGAEVPEHSHTMEQMTWLISGTMDVKIGDDARRRIEPGTVLLIPGGTPHKFWYLDQCTIVEFAAPPRLDWFPHAVTHPYGIARGEDAQN